MPSEIGELVINIGGNTASFSQQIDACYGKVERLAGKSKEIGHSTVTSVQAASGALRELQGNFGENVRAVERFLTTIPGVGDALKAAFPLVGGLAFGAMLGELGMKVAAFAKAGHEAAKNTARDFDTLNDSTRKAGAELDVTGDKIQNAIAKLEHTPENNLKLALDEDRKAAYEMAETVDTADRKVTALLKEHSTGIGKQLGLALVGQNVSITTASEKVVKDANAEVRTASRKNVQSEEALTPDRMRKRQRFRIAPTC